MPGVITVLSLVAVYALLRLTNVGTDEPDRRESDRAALEIFRKHP